MADFNVIWEINVDAASPEDAARMARASHRLHESMPSVYLVGDEDGNRTTVYLDGIG